MAPLWGEPLKDSPHKGPVMPSQMASNAKSMSMSWFLMETIWSFIVMLIYNKNAHTACIRFHLSAYNQSMTLCEQLPLSNIITPLQSTLTNKMTHLSWDVYPVLVCTHRTYYICFKCIFIHHINQNYSEIIIHFHRLLHQLSYMKIFIWWTL